MSDQQYVDITTTQIGTELCMHILAGVLIETKSITAEVFLRIVGNLAAGVENEEVRAPLLRLRDAVELLAAYVPDDGNPNAPRASMLRLIPGGKTD